MMTTRPVTIPSKIPHSPLVTSLDDDLLETELIRTIHFSEVTSAYCQLPDLYPSISMYLKTRKADAHLILALILVTIDNLIIIS